MSVVSQKKKLLLFVYVPVHFILLWSPEVHNADVYYFVQNAHCNLWMIISYRRKIMHLGGYEHKVIK